MRLVFYLTFAFFYGSMSQLAFGLPIGFGINQGHLKYSEIQGRNSQIYHDSRTPREARMVEASLAAAQPIMEKWFGKKQQKIFPVVMSAETDGASFANLVTDTIELQTLGQGSRDLFFHEYAHMMMYRHLQNFLGPAGALIHLPWMPAWFIEGLAEAISVSVGSDWQAGIERYQALTGDWPSYDRLHSLYGQGNFFLRGYGTSGGFVQWLLKRNSKAEALPGFLTRFFEYTWPQYYLWSANPFSRFMPMDEALLEFYYQDGAELYEAYKRESRQYWESNRKGPLLVSESGQRLNLRSISQMHRNANGNAAIVGWMNQRRQLLSLSADPQTGWVVGLKSMNRLLPRKIDSFAHLFLEESTIFINSVEDIKNGQPRQFLSMSPAHRDPDRYTRPILKIDGFVQAIYLSRNHVILFEQAPDKSRACLLDRQLIEPMPSSPIPRSRLRCPLEVELADSLKPLGARYDSHGLVKGVFYLRQTETLKGNRNAVYYLDLESPKPLQLKDFSLQAEPLKIVERSDKLWTLNREHGYRVIREISPSGLCQKQLLFSDVVTDLFADQKGDLWVRLWSGPHSNLLRLNASHLQLATACQPVQGMTSPLIYALQSKKNSIPSLHRALLASRYWHRPGVHLKAEVERVSQARQQAVALDLVSPDKIRSKPAKWRGRPILALPWVGADDVHGAQLGVVSVPLMDFMQNETIRLTMLYGVASRYPNTHLSVLSTRYWPTLSLNFYRRQAFNGIGLMPNRSIATSYLDEKGMSLQSSWALFLPIASMSVQSGVSLSQRSRYLGPYYALEGNLQTFHLGLVAFKEIKDTSLSLSASGKVAIPNATYDYNKFALGFRVAHSLDFANSDLSLKLSYGRTRGHFQKTPILKEYYLPQQTFLAGSGGGYTQNSFNLLGVGTLFSPRYGDSRFKSELRWQVPIIDSFEKQIWLFYLESLKFVAFVNRGGAWFQSQNPYSRMVSAHGYMMNLFLENKGVRFNSGVGLGQVYNQDFQFFLTLGFNALF